MNYSKELEIQQKGKTLEQEYMYLIVEMLKRNILSINFRPGSFVHSKAFGLEQKFVFSGKFRGKAASGIIGIVFKENKNRSNNHPLLMEYLELYVEGSTEKIKVRFDENLNIILCEGLVLNEDTDEIRFLNLENAQANFAKINYYDGEATELVRSNNPEIVMPTNFPEEIYTLNGLLPDRETVIPLESQEDLESVISTFLDDPEKAEKIYRGEIKLIKDNGERKNVEN